ncbi:MAG: DUF5011 domain-containing protein [Patescibacteria group bacterium]|nr:DUF5011 domain-containing protein [Methanomethylophilus sp.]MDD3284152.1 DUF5011 domain-containing protein [Patescibacteria group bacterium]MDD4304645.1 DUF5011 domain-containing protein [Patescibacteria group bacterium]MDD4695572.1 DUF5011 domain-containing protein [Patescibacteria group bacterium]
MNILEFQKYKKLFNRKSLHLGNYALLFLVIFVLSISLLFKVPTDRSLITNALSKEGDSIDEGISIIPDKPLIVKGLSNDSIPTQSKTWTWSSDDVNAIYRYVINQNETHKFTDEKYGTTTTATQAFGDGIYYIHVQAQDSLKNVSLVETVYAVLDNTGPTITIFGFNPTSIYQYYTYIDEGAMAIDSIDSSHTTIHVTMENDVNTSIIGNYSVQYIASDKLGNISTSTRVVDVLVRPSTGSVNGMI